MNDVYCGPAPMPTALWAAWNFDPPLLLSLLALPLAVALSSPSPRPSRAVLAAAILALIVAFVSPLCALASALFSARLTHHILMIAVAAPLLAMAAPHWRLPVRVPLAVIVIAHTLAVWFWHAPSPYSWATSSTASYWVMEISLFLAAFWMWSEIFASPTRPAAALAALFATVVQMGLLGAIITFARTPLYDLHAGVTAPFGLTQLEDQQLAGLIMWVPAALPYLIAAGFILSRLLARSSSEVQGQEA